MNPEMSGSEAESSDMEEMAHNHLGDAPADSDDEGFAWKASRGGTFAQSGRNRDVDEDEDEEDEDEEERVQVVQVVQVVQAAEEEDDDDEALPEAAQEEEDDDDDDDDDEEEASKAPPVKTMHQWLQKPTAVAAPKKKSAAQTKEATKSHKQKAVRTGSDSAWGAGAASQKNAAVAISSKRPQKSTDSKGKQSSRARTFTAQANDDSDDDLASTSMTDLTNKGVPMPPPDAVQEFEDHRAGLSNGTGDAEAAGLEEALSHVSVHESARERVYIIKNEKVNKWFLFNPDGFVYAPDIRTPESSGLFDFTTEQLTVPSKKERISMQEKLIDTHGTQAMNTVCIAKLKTDGSGSGAGPGTHTLAMLLPGKKASPGTEMEDLETKMRQLGMIDADETGRKEIVVLMVLDHELAKRLYKIDKNPLPQVFNPNTNATTKYKVPSRLEDTAKMDTNFVIIGVAEKARRAGKRMSEDLAANGDGGRADAKRAANGASASGSAPEEAVTMDAARLPHDTPGLAMKMFSGKQVAFCFAELTCACNESYSVIRVGDGKWVLIKSS